MQKIRKIMNKSCKKNQNKKLTSILHYPEPLLLAALSNNYQPTACRRTTNKFTPGGEAKTINIIYRRLINSNY